MGDLPFLFEALRKACSPADWSRGVELWRAGAVLADRSEPDVERLRVSEKGGLITRDVALFLDDASWECNCGAAACAHSAAAAIALRRAGEDGAPLVAAAEARGRIAYRLVREPGGLALERGVSTAGGFRRIDATLAAIAQGRVGGPAFTASQADLAVELALGTHRTGPLPRAAFPKLLDALRRCDDVRLDGHPVKVATGPVVPRVVVADQGDGFRLTLEPDPRVSEVFANGLARCGDEIRPVGEPGLTAREREELRAGLRVPPERAAELVQTVLPSLSRRIPVDVRTSRLPATVEVAPRVQLEVRRDGYALEVLATIVYGDPPCARVDAGELVHLGGPVPRRDERAEVRLARRLAEELGLAPGVRARVAWDEAVALNARLDAWGGSVRGAGREWFRLAPPLVPRVRAQGDDLDVAFVVEEPGRAPGRADAGAVLAAWREGESLVPLVDGGFSPLPADWLARFGNQVADLLAAREAAGGTLPRGALPDLARLCEDLELPPPPGLQGLRDLVQGFDRLPAAELPPDLHAELRPYQRRGVDWLAFLRDAGLGGMLADDMGLGKTLQALCAISGRTLVVAPTSVLPNWVHEAGRFRPGLRVALYHGPRRRLDRDADLTVTSYALLRLEEEALGAVPWDTVVLDEAQTIKNPDSQVAGAAFRLPARWRLTLTGTPVENRLDELWSQMHFVQPGLLGGRRDFAERYARPIAEGRDDVAARLRERIRPFLLRRLKREVAPELPPRTEAVLWCALTEDERRVYDAVAAATRRDVLARLAAGGSVLAALEALLRLRQAACHAGLVPGQSAETSSKVERLVEALETLVAEGHKALVFSQWTSLLDRIEPHLEGAGIARTRLDGSTVDRGAVVESFQDPAGPPVLLVSLKAGGTGLNLTAADHVFLMDPWWNPAVEDQAADRAHRIGQDRPVLVYRLVAEDTVEERILALQESKRALAAAALEEGGRAAALTREDLLALLA